MDFVVDLNGRLGEGWRGRARYAATADLERLGLDRVRDWFEREYGDPEWHVRIPGDHAAP